MTITLAEAKAYMNVTDEADDALITSFIKAAKAYLSEYVDCPMTCSAAPDPVKQATKMLVASMYESREGATDEENARALPSNLGVFDLIAPYRVWAF